MRVKNYCHAFRRRLRTKSTGRQAMDDLFPVPVRVSPAGLDLSPAWPCAGEIGIEPSEVRQRPAAGRTPLGSRAVVELLRPDADPELAPYSEAVPVDLTEPS